MKKYLILDFGKVLFYPVTGHWFITPLLIKIVDMDRINQEDLQKAMEKYNNILSQKITTEEEEYEMFYEFYRNVFKEIQYFIQDSDIRKIAYDITYHDEKYKMYDKVKEELEILSKKYTLLLLSDNWPCAIRILKNNEIYDYFEKIYISSIYGVQKKDKVFFDYPIDDYEIQKTEAIFVDDNEKLLDIAVQKGLEVRLMNREKEEINSKYKMINNLLEI